MTLRITWDISGISLLVRRQTPPYSFFKLGYSYERNNNRKIDIVRLTEQLNNIRTITRRLNSSI